jgi:hypothetical protein
MEKIPRKIIRRMGFQAECQGLIDRYIQVEGAWDDHLSRTREFICNAVAGKNFDNLAVLGSGWLLDLPLDELVDISGHVWLYDVVHPAQIIHKLRKYKHVTPISGDITGGCIVNAWHAVKQYKRTGVKVSPELLCNRTFQPEVVHDMIISLNLMSQIGVMINSYLQRHIPYGRDELERINCILQQAHLDLLLRGRSCLVTDIREINVGFSSGLEETSELLCVTLPNVPDAQTWEWQFDPGGNYKPGKKTRMQVVAMEF